MRTAAARLVIATLLLSPIAIGLAAQSSLPAAPGAHVVTITPPGLTGSEPAIAVNPRNPDQVVAGAGRLAAWSVDGGQTFTPVQPAGANGRGGGDVSFA